MAKLDVMLLCTVVRSIYTYDCCVCCRTQNKGRSGDKSDMFKDSLSEGLKAEKSSSSEEEEIGDINIEEDEDEEQIIQKRRKQREELLRVNF